MKPRTKALLTAGPLALVGTAFIVLASLPLVGALFIFSWLAAGGNPGTQPPLLTTFLILLCIPAQLVFLGLVSISAANCRVTPGSRVANIPMLLLAAAVLALTTTALILGGQPIPLILLPFGIVFPFVIIVMRFDETPTPANME